MKRLPVIVFIVIVLAAGVFFYLSDQQIDLQAPSAPTLDTSAPVASPAASGITTGRRAGDWQNRLQSRLRQAKWSSVAIDAVWNNNQAWFSILRENHPHGLENQIQLFEKLGRYTHLMPLLTGHPETATLLAQAYEPEALAAVLRNDDCYDVFGGLFVQHSHPLDTADLARALERHGNLICRLIQQGIVGAQALFLYPESDGGKAYGEWTHAVLESALHGSAEDLISLVNLLHQQGAQIRRRMIEDAGFRRDFPRILWPRLARVVEGAGRPFEFYLEDPHLWELAAHPEGERLLEQWVWIWEKIEIGPAGLLYGEYAYPRPLHGMIIQAILTENEGELYPLLQYGQDPSFVSLMQRELPDSKRYALFMRLNQSAEGYVDKLIHLDSLETSALMEELGDEPLALLPGQDAWNTTKKLLQGRDVSMADVGFAVWDTLDTGMMLVTFGGSAILTTTLKQGVKGAVKQGGKAALKNTAKSGLLSRARASVGRYVGKKTASRVSEAGLMPWLKRELLSTMQTTFGKQAAQQAGKKAAAAAFDITPMTRWMFQNAGVNRNTMKTVSGLDARLFMRKDAKVLVKVDSKKASGAVRQFFRDTVVNSGGEAAEELLENQAAHAVAETGASLLAVDAAQAIRQNISAWWSLQSIGLLN